MLADHRRCRNGPRKCKAWRIRLRTSRKTRTGMRKNRRNRLCLTIPRGIGDGSSSDHRLRWRKENVSDLRSVGQRGVGVQAPQTPIGFQPASQGTPKDQGGESKDAKCQSDTLGPGNSSQKRGLSRDTYTGEGKEGDGSTSEEVVPQSKRRVAQHRQQPLRFQSPTKCYKWWFVILLWLTYRGIGCQQSLARGECILMNKRNSQWKDPEPLKKAVRERTLIS